jgi:hypothetical protein
MAVANPRPRLAARTRARFPVRFKFIRSPNSG